MYYIKSKRWFIVYQNIYYICTNCGSGFYYFESPVAERCFCGAELRKGTKEEFDKDWENKSNVNLATCSC